MWSYFYKKVLNESRIFQHISAAPDKHQVYDIQNQQNSEYTANVFWILSAYSECCRFWKSYIWFLFEALEGSKIAKDHVTHRSIEKFVQIKNTYF
jgi:hypothetical protein